MIAFIGLGSNLGDGCRNLLTGWRSLGRIEGIRLLRLSSPYRTSPVGMRSPRWFTNAVGKLSCLQTPEELLDILLGIEQAMGRDRRRDEADGPADRTLDLDLLACDAQVRSGPELVLPHPAMAKRRFVLEPLAEIEPDFRHPVLRQTPDRMLALLARGPDRGEEVRKMDWPEETA